MLLWILNLGFAASNASVWTVQSDDNGSWSAQSNDASIWTVQTDDGSSWS